MNVQTAIYLLSIAGGIIVVLLGVCGFFLNRFVNSVDKLTIAVTELKTYVKLQESGCVATHQVVTQRLNAHSDKLNKHESEIEVLKEKTKDL